MKMARGGLRALSIAAGITVALVALAPAAAREQESAARGGAAAAQWPDSAAGRLGRGWVEAFNRGEPAMRRFLAENLAAGSLAERGVEARLATYRELRERLGRLTLAEVTTVEAHAVTVVFADGEALRHEFTFESEPEPPHQLVRVSGRVTQRHGGPAH